MTEHAAGEGQAATALPSLGRRAASGAMWITIEMIAVQGTSLVVFTILAHLLEPHDFGLIAISFAFVYSLKSLAIDQAITPVMRKEAATDLEWTTTFWITVTLGLLAALLLCALSFFADPIFNAHGLGAVMRPMSLLLIAFSFGQTQEAWLVRHFRLRVLAIRSIAGILLGSGAGIAAALMGFGVWALVIQQLRASFSALGLLWLSTPWRPSFSFSKRSANETMKFARGISGNTLIGIFNQNADTALVAAFFGASTVGVYTVGKRLKLALQLIAATPVTGVTLSAFSEAQGNAHRLQQVFLTGTRLVLTFCAPVFIGAAAVATPVIGLVFGAKWSGASSVFAWLSVGALLTIAFDYCASILLLRNRPVWITLLAALQTVLSIGLFALMKATGQTEIAGPFVLPYLVVTPICIALALSLLELRIGRWITAAGVPVLAALIMLLCLSGASQLTATLPTLTKLFVLVSAGAAIYGTLMLFLARDTLRSLLELASLRTRRV